MSENSGSNFVEQAGNFAVDASVDTAADGTTGAGKALSGNYDLVGSF